MRPKNLPVGPLSAVSPETLQSVSRVLKWYLGDGRFGRPEAGVAPSWEDEQVARDFAQAVRLAAEAGEGEKE